MITDNQVFHLSKHPAKSNAGFLLALVGFLLFFLMLFVPTTYKEVKAVLLAVLLCALGIAILRQNGGFRLHRSIAVWTLIIATTGIFFMLVGAANAAPGALRVGTVYVLWPVVFTILIGGLVSENSIHKLLAVLVYSGIALGLYGAMVFGHALGWLPDALYVEIDQGQIVGLYKGYVEYNMYSIATLFFLVPFLFSAILHWERQGGPIVARRWLWPAYALCLALAILSGRRALWLVLLLTPVIHWGLSQFSQFSVSAQDSRSATLRTSARLLLVSVAVFLLLKMIFGLSLSAMAGRLTSAFGAPSLGALEESASIRYAQAAALFSGWLESPWIGMAMARWQKGLCAAPNFPGLMSCLIWRCSSILACLAR